MVLSFHTGYSYYKEAGLKMFLKLFKTFLMRLKRDKWEKEISPKRSFRSTIIRSLAARNPNGINFNSFEFSIFLSRSYTPKNAERARPSSSGTFHILLGLFAYFIIRFLKYHLQVTKLKNCHFVKSIPVSIIV